MSYRLQGRSSEFFVDLRSLAVVGYYTGIAMLACLVADCNASNDDGYPADMP